MNRISAVRDFWNANPCDSQPDYARRSAFRYRKDGWIVPILEKIARNYRNVLEVGCGQGTDGITLCSMLRQGSFYTGVDISEVSLSRAEAAAEEVLDRLRVRPVFRLDNAEQLSFPDNHFDCVLSVGALHHSASVERAVQEVKRVLAPGGSAFIALYRTTSPKVLGAHALRGFQRCVDAVLQTDRALYRSARAFGVGDGLGTAIYECFGVPILRSYTQRGVRALFRDFASVRLSSHGPAFLTRRLPVKDATPIGVLGYLWLAEAKKDQ